VWTYSSVRYSMAWPAGFLSERKSCATCICERQTGDGNGHLLNPSGEMMVDPTQPIGIIESILNDRNFVSFFGTQRSMALHVRKTM
jgi:hypothetical protein